MQPCSLSVAVLGRNWHFVLTMLWLVVTPRGIKGKQGGRLPGLPAPALHGPGEGTGEWWMMPGCGVCPSLSSLVLPSLTIPASKKPPSTAPWEGQLQAEHPNAQEEGGSFQHQHGPKYF